jgi:hypothetical protein
MRKLRESRGKRKPQAAAEAGAEPAAAATV